MLELFSDKDQTFINRFASLPRHGRTRRYVARERTDLYPGRPDLAEEYSHQLKSGYWVGINISKKQVERIVTMACEVARLTFGVDLKINLG